MKCLFNMIHTFRYIPVLIDQEMCEIIHSYRIFGFWWKGFPEKFFRLIHQSCIDKNVSPCCFNKCFRCRDTFKVGTGLFKKSICLNRISNGKWKYWLVTDQTYVIGENLLCFYIKGFFLLKLTGFMVSSSEIGVVKDPKWINPPFFINIKGLFISGKLIVSDYYENQNYNKNLLSVCG